MLRSAELALRPDLTTGVLSVSPSRRHLSGPAGQAQLEPVVMKVLLLLLDGGGQVVTRQTLLDQAWGNVQIGDDSLNRAVGRIRSTLAEVAPDAFILETIPRTGYRLALAGDHAPVAGAAPARAPDGVDRRRLVGGAVAGLAALGLGVGSWRLLRRDDRDPRSPLVDRAHAELVSQELGSEKRATALLRRAVAENPDDAQAWGLLAYALTSHRDIPKVEAMGETNRALATALRLDPDQPDALLAQTTLRQSMRDWLTSDRELRRILAIDPDHEFALGALTALLQMTGMLRESWQFNEHLLAVNPLSPEPWARRGMKLWIFGKLPEADGAADEALLRWPKVPICWQARFIIFAFTGRADAALRMLDDSARHPTPFPPGARDSLRTTLTALADPRPATIAAARTAIYDGAQRFAMMTAYGVLALASLGDVDSAFEVANGFLLGTGRRANPRLTSDRNLVTTIYWRATQWLFTPPLAEMRKDPRFVTLCEGIGLGDYWRARGVHPDGPPLGRPA